MHFQAIATDYDGTLASDGRVPHTAVEALERLRASGRSLILVTGRELDDLREAFPHLQLFDRVVAENGALLYRPKAQEERVLADPLHPTFRDALRSRRVEPLSEGRVIVATWHPNESAVLDTIRELGLELQVIFNKGAVMVLPAGVNKATGLSSALGELGLSFRNVVGIGDAENDHAFLSACEVSFAVANALDALKERCDVVTRGDHAAGVLEVIEGLLEDDLASIVEATERLLVPLGERDGDEPVGVHTGMNAMIAGPSASGKSTLTTAFLETVTQRGYQFCLIDPEGDYSEFEDAVSFGDADTPPNFDAVFELLENPSQSAVVNLLGVPLDDRPDLLQAALPRFNELRARFGRPHWLVIDEAHHGLPQGEGRLAQALPQDTRNMVFITVHPEHVAPEILRSVDLLVATADADSTLASYARAMNERPALAQNGLELEPSTTAAAWYPGRSEPPFVFRVARPERELKRHARKYAKGDVQEKAFVFRGPDGKLNLRAQNLALFAQIGSGVDDETWLHHLRRGDYSSWIRDAIKDEELAEEAERAEREASDSAEESRRRILGAVEQRYTAPA
jgi:HAD superfamily hydrolase (TIGR01484 family)